MKRLPSSEATLEGYALPRIAPPSSISFDEMTVEDSAPPTGTTPFGPPTSEVDLAGFLDRGLVGRAGAMLWQAQRALERRNLPVSAPVVLASGIALVVGFFFVASFGVVHASDDAVAVSPVSASAPTALSAAAAPELAHPAEPREAEPVPFERPSLVAPSAPAEEPAVVPAGSAADMTFDAPVSAELVPEPTAPTARQRRARRRIQAQRRARRARARARRRARAAW